MCFDCQSLGGLNEKILFTSLWRTDPAVRLVFFQAYRVRSVGFLTNQYRSDSIDNGSHLAWQK